LNIAPEVHGAQILPDPDYRSDNVIPPTKTAAPFNFGFIKFSPNRSVEAAEACKTLFRAALAVAYGGMGMGSNISYEPFPIEVYLHAKFH
jgi:hypothetical protein